MLSRSQSVIVAKEQNETCVQNLNDSMLNDTKNLAHLRTVQISCDRAQFNSVLIRIRKVAGGRYFLVQPPLWKNGRSCSGEKEISLEKNGNFNFKISRIR
jgi:hypothetical protein